MGSRSLRSALNISAEEIRCTSVDGYRLPGGANTIEQLRREVQDARAFVGVISAASLESVYFVFELGARWGTGKRLLPVLVPGTDAHVLSGPLHGINALRCDSAGQLQQLINDLSRQLKIRAEPSSAYQRQIDHIVQYSPQAEDGQGQRQTDDSPSHTDSLARTLSEQELKILVAVSQQGRATASSVASTVGISEQKAKFCLDELARQEGLIDWFGNMDPALPDHYMLSHKGRGVLVARGVFD